MHEDNKNLQNILEKHRVNGKELQDENEQLRVEIERLRKIEEDILDKCDVLESTDQDMAQALKEIRDQELLHQVNKLEKHSKNVPKLNLEKVQEIMRLKCEESNMSYAEEEEEEASSYENSDRLQYQIQRYYSQRRSDEGEGSESEVSNYKNNIRQLLQSSIKKSLNSESEMDENPKLFDYELKNDSIEVFEEQQMSKEQPLLEQNELSEDSKMLEKDQYMLYDSSSSSCESYYSNQMMDENSGAQPFVPMLKLGGGGAKANHPVPPINPSLNQGQVPGLNLGSMNESNGNKPTQQFQVPPIIPKLNTKKKSKKKLNLENIKQKDFQDEFMENYDDFSESWRQLIDEGKRF
jgi:hypothetical protein